jgi:hypothetical protein
MVYGIHRLCYEVQSHERMKETPLDAKHRKQAQQSRVFGVFFVLFNYDEAGIIDDVTVSPQNRQPTAASATSPVDW